MEKGTPHCPLPVVNALLEKGKIRATVSALAGAAAIGVGFEEMIRLIALLSPADFYKSMTSYTDHTRWQDVYRARTFAGEVYIKLIVVDDVLIVSFKEL